MDPSALYYTFSTIAQTLAGAFGFLLAVALYRVQAIEAVMFETMHKIRRTDTGEIVVMYWEYHPYDLEVAHLKRDWGAVESILANAPVEEGADQKDGMRYYPEMFALFRADKARLDRIQTDLGLAMRLTGWTVAGCLVALPLSGALAESKWAASPPLIAAVVAALTCIAAFYPLIRGVTR